MHELKTAAIKSLDLALEGTSDIRKVLEIMQKHAPYAGSEQFKEIDVIFTRLKDDWLQDLFTKCPQVLMKDAGLTQMVSDKIATASRKNHVMIECQKCCILYPLSGGANVFCRLCNAFLGTSKAVCTNNAKRCAIIKVEEN